MMAGGGVQDERAGNAARAPSIGGRILAALYRYWFGGHGFPLSLAMVRIGVALFVLCSGLVAEDYALLLQTQNPEAYRPRGILILFGAHVPPAALFTTASKVGTITAWLMVVGLFTRTAVAVNFICNLLLASLTVSFTAHWGHMYSILLTTQMALVWARSGDALSLDAFLRHVLRRPVTNRAPGVYRWPLLLAQFAVALPFANAVWWKLHSDGFGLGWIFSDNLRHTLAVQYFVLGREPPALVAWIMARRWRYTATALGNVLSQTAPLTACFLIRYPVVRALCGGFYCLELLGLCSVMSLCGFGQGWIWLSVVFVDWDRLLAWLGRRFPSIRKWASLAVPAAETESARGQAPQRLSRLYVRLAGAFVAAFLGFWVLVGVHNVGDVDWTYPFTSYPLFFAIRAKKPYSEHQTWEQYGTLFDLEAESPVSEEARGWVYRSYWSLSWYDLQYVQEQSVQMWNHLEKGFRLKMKRIAIKKTVHQIPAYPAFPRPAPLHSELKAILTAGGFIGVGTAVEWDPTMQRNRLAIRSIGLIDPRFELGYIREKTDGPHPLPGFWKGDKYYFAKEPGNYLIVVDVTDRSLPGGHARFFGDEVW